MHVIIEGVDGSGKSALALELARRLYMPVVNAIRQRSDRHADDVVRALLAREPTVFDRLHLSELVYGPLKRGASRFSPDDVAAIERACADAGAFCVVCRVADAARAASAETGRRYIEPGEFAAVVAAFDAAVAASRLDWHGYVAGDDVDAVAVAAWARSGGLGAAPTWGGFIGEEGR